MTGRHYWCPCLQFSDNHFLMRQGDTGTEGKKKEVVWSTNWDKEEGAHRSKTGDKVQVLPVETHKRFWGFWTRGGDRAVQTRKKHKNLALLNPAPWGKGGVIGPWCEGGGGGGGSSGKGWRRGWARVETSSAYSAGINCVVKHWKYSLGGRAGKKGGKKTVPRAPQMGPQRVGKIWPGQQQGHEKKDNKKTPAKDGNFWATAQKNDKGCQQPWTRRNQKTPEKNQTVKKPRPGQKHMETKNTKDTKLT